MKRESERGGAATAYAPSASAAGSSVATPAAGACEVSPLFGDLHIVFRDYQLDQWDEDWHYRRIFGIADADRSEPSSLTDEQQHTASYIRRSFNKVHVHLLPDPTRPPMAPEEGAADTGKTFPTQLARLWGLLIPSLNTPRRLGGPGAYGVGPVITGQVLSDLCIGTAETLNTRGVLEVESLAERLLQAAAFRVIDEAYEPLVLMDEAAWAASDMLPTTPAAVELFQPRSTLVEVARNRCPLLANLSWTLADLRCSNRAQVRAETRQKGILDRALTVLGSAMKATVSESILMPHKDAEEGLLRASLQTAANAHAAAHPSSTDPVVAAGACMAVLRPVADGLRQQYERQLTRLQDTLYISRAPQPAELLPLADPAWAVLMRTAELPGAPHIPLTGEAELTHLRDSYAGFAEHLLAEEVRRAGEQASARGEQERELACQRREREAKESERAAKRVLYGVAVCVAAACIVGPAPLAKAAAVAARAAFLL